VKKNQGATIGAVLMAALLVRGTGSGFLGTARTEEGKSATQTAARGIKKGEGPWIASCEYWAPLRLVEKDSASENSSVKVTLKKSTDELSGTLVTPDSAQEAACEGSENSWGFPQKSTPVIAAIIAAQVLHFGEVFGTIENKNSLQCFPRISWNPVPRIKFIGGIKLGSIFLQTATKQFGTLLQNGGIVAAHGRQFNL
jgi:hypothetical protein